MTSQSTRTSAPGWPRRVWARRSAAQVSDMGSHYRTAYVTSGTLAAPAGAGPVDPRGAYDCSRSGRDARWYSAGVQHEVWARLTSPFPSEALAWIVAEIEPGGGRARLEPAWFPDAVRRRLDSQLGLEGWSFALSGTGSGVVCALTFGSVTRSAVAGAGHGVTLAQLADLAFARCARQFGIAPQVLVTDDSYWVDYDEEAGEPLFQPEAVPAGAGEMPAPAPLVAPAAPGSPGPLVDAPDEPAESGAAPVALEEGPGSTEPAREASSEALAMIERLLDRLKAEGLGKEAAKLVARYHGDTAEQARELYGRLSALLEESGG